MFVWKQINFGFTHLVQKMNNLINIEYIAKVHS